MGVFRCIMVPVFLSTAVSAVHAGGRPATFDAARDNQQTLQARKLLAEDPELASVNIGVVVMDRVAMLWGPVPSAEIAVAAEYRLRGMAELKGVRNELRVSEEMEAIRVPLKIDVPPVTLPNPAPAPKKPAQPLPAIGAPGVLTAEVKVLSPIPSIAVVVRQPEPIGPSGADRDLESAIRIVLQSKTTYAAIQFAVQDRRVFLRAADQYIDALHEASRDIARLPNVAGVILVDKNSPR